MKLQSSIAAVILALVSHTPAVARPVTLCYGLMIGWPIDNLARWLSHHGVHVAIEQPQPGALYVGHSAGAIRCAAMAAANHGSFVGIDPVPPAGGITISSAALGTDHLSVVNDPRTRATILQMAHR